MLMMKPVSDPGALGYLCREMGIAQGCDFCYLAQDAGPLAAVAFSVEGGQARLLALDFLGNGPDPSLADGLLRAALNYAELHWGAREYLFFPCQELSLTDLGFAVGESTSIPALFERGGGCCGR